MQVDKVAEHIIQWLKDYSLNSKTRGFVLGVSGGIDSAVTSALAARTGRPTLLLEMPIYQSDSQVNRARMHIADLEKNFDKVSSKEIELTPTFDSLINALPKTKDMDREMSLANARARLRMTTMYYFAGLQGKIVVGTGNKVEDFGVGFYTKYGDGGVDVSPIADLMKSEVYALGEYLGVNDLIMKAPPTDGLWGDDRTDEDQIGASYPELEWAMEFESSDDDETGLEPRQKEVLEIYRKLNRANQHKMQPIPVCTIPDSLR